MAIQPHHSPVRPELTSRLIAGAGKREPWEADYSPTAPSQVTHVAQCVVFGAVMADAAMLDAVLEMDVWGRERGADGCPQHGVQVAGV